MRQEKNPARARLQTPFQGQILFVASYQHQCKRKGLVCQHCCCYLHLRRDSLEGLGMDR